MKASSGEKLPGTAGSVLLGSKRLWNVRLLPEATNANVSEPDVVIVFGLPAGNR
jgi:hypothetical protein